MTEKKSFWATLPGILTGAAGVITALTALYIAVDSSNKGKISQGVQPSSPPLVQKTTTGPSNWPLVMRETFSKEPLNWDIGNFSTKETPRFELKIVDGKYRWDVKFAEERYRWIRIPVGSAINFDVRVDVKVIEFTDEMAVNLFFNSAGNEQYIFGISSSRYFALHRIDTDNIARRVLKWTPISVEFNPRAWNEMRVVVDEQLIRIYLNSKLLGEYRDTNLTGGQTGIGVEMYKNGAVIVDFDNFQFRRKP